MRASSSRLTLLIVCSVGFSRVGAACGSTDRPAQSSDAAAADSAVPSREGSRAGQTDAATASLGADAGLAPRADAGPQPDASVGGSVADAGTSDKLVPAEGALLGHFYGNGTVAATDAKIGRKPSVHLTYFGWTDDWTKNEAPAQDLAEGRIPLVNWEPEGVKFTDIIDGKEDAVIQARAVGAKALGAPFFLDFAAEMNGDEGTAWTGNDAAVYIAAYRHIHDLFQAKGATNAVWVWAPNVTDVDGGNAHTLDYYPGDAYVDWTGVDGYNWGTSDKDFTWLSFHDVFKDIYPLLAAKGKPILIGEMASDEVGGDKAKWIDDIVPTLQSDFPSIRAFVWFDIKKERAWQIDSSAGSLAAYKRLALDPYMK